MPTEVSNHINRGHSSERAIARWARIAVSHATLRDCDDPPGLIATVIGIDGAWGFGTTHEIALEDLESVLVDWVSLKLQDGDNDIPSMEGLHPAATR